MISSFASWRAQLTSSLQVVVDQLKTRRDTGNTTQLTEVELSNTVDELMKDFQAGEDEPSWKIDTRRQIVDRALEEMILNQVKK